MVMLAASLVLAPVPDGGCVLVNAITGEGEWDGSLSGIRNFDFFLNPGTWIRLELE